MAYNKEVRKAYLKRNADKIAKQKKEWYDKNKQQQLDYGRTWRANNKEHMREYQRNKIIQDPLYKLKKNIKTCIWASFNQIGTPKPSKTELILGCTYEELLLHLERQFEEWMNWNNKGNWNGTPDKPNVAWDVDHIIPLATAKNVSDVIKLNHYTNLQPLCSYTNRYIKQNNML